ncbi:hypothetical protein YIM_33015 [Amycolatopsis sp. YIM 10]|nr:hypothetical protein YIM_33015 [Amycolatopsis sp. YIM 10]
MRGEARLADRDALLATSLLPTRAESDLATEQVKANAIKNNTTLSTAMREKVHRDWANLDLAGPAAEAGGEVGAADTQELGLAGAAAGANTMGAGAQPLSGGAPAAPGTAQSFATDAVQQAGHNLGVAHAELAQAGQEGPGTQDLEEARREFFGEAPPGAQRRILQTDAKTNGDDGIIVSRFYIGDPTAAFGMLNGDNREPSTEPDAPHRFSVAWDTRTGEVSFTLTPSTTPGGDSYDALPINFGPGGVPNNFVLNRLGPDGIDIDYNVLNSGVKYPVVEPLSDPPQPKLDEHGRPVWEQVPFGEANGNFSISLDGDRITVRHNGDDYPDGEFIQYRGEGTRELGTKEMARPGGGWLPPESTPALSDIFPGFGQNDYTFNAPR